jgi:protein involved in polysaccharide export with SLBB domain
MLYFAAGCRFADAADYSLNAGDRLSLKVMEWRPDRGEAYEWPGISGEYAVGVDGAVLLPIVGPVSAGDRTVTDVAKDIGRKLQQQAGLANPLQVSLQIAQYRPCYVLGSVEKPGEYAYRPNLTVLEAVSLAGGMYRAQDVAMQLERQQIEANGALSGLASERRMLQTERARLQAEADNAHKIAFPQDPDRTAAAVQSVQQTLFDSRETTLNMRLQSFDETKRLYASEIDTLKEKLRVLSSQADLNKQELDNIYDLMKKGLTTEPRKIALQQDLDQIESTKLEYQLSIIRAQQGVANAERDKEDAVNARKSEALKEIATIDAKIAQNDSARATAIRLAREADTRLMREDDRALAEQSAPSYTVRRKGVEQPIRLAETDMLLPGDVLKVGDGRPADVSN